MFTFTRTGNVVKVAVSTTDSAILFMSPDSFVHVRDNKIYIYQGDVYQPIFPDRNGFVLSVFDINGRPSDDLNTVAQWLIDNYFYGQDYSAGGGGGGDATAANQVTQITQLSDIDTNLDTVNSTLTAFSNKTASAFVEVPFDKKVFAYLGSGDIDYISYELSASEVARLTFGYNGANELTSITRTV